MGLYACVAPMHPWSRVHEGSGLFASVLQDARMIFLAGAFLRLCASQRDAGATELSVHKCTYRWPAVSLGSDAENEQH